MAKKYELEKRAVVKPELVGKIIKLLDKEAKLEKTFKRFSIIFWNHAETKPAEASQYDFRIRITGNKGLFTLKYGDWRGGGREEYEFHFDTEELDDVVNIMRVWGQKWGTTTRVERRKYDYQGMEMVIDRYLDDGRGILEIEKKCQSEKDFEKNEKVIDKLMNKWGLESMTKEGMVEFVRSINDNENNYFDISSENTDKYVRMWLEKSGNS